MIYTRGKKGLNFIQLRKKAVVISNTTVFCQCALIEVTKNINLDVLSNIELALIVLDSKKAKITMAGSLVTLEVSIPGFSASSGITE